MCERTELLEGKWGAAAALPLVQWPGSFSRSLPIPCSHKEEIWDWKRSQPAGRCGLPTDLLAFLSTFCPVPAPGGPPCPHRVPVVCRVVLRGGGRAPHRASEGPADWGELSLQRVPALGALPG